MLSKKVGSFALKVIFSFFFAVILCHTSNARDTSRPRESIRNLHALLHAAPHTFLGHCDFEVTCDWSWNQTNGFRNVTAIETSHFGPSTDANNQLNGSCFIVFSFTFFFLFFFVTHIHSLCCRTLLVAQRAGRRTDLVQGVSKIGESMSS